MNAAQIIAAVTPEPWQALSLASGMTAAGSGYTPAARQWFDQIQLSGAIAGTITSGTLVATLPASMWPAQNVNVPCVIGNGAAQLIISTAGNVTVDVASTVTAVHLDGLSYRLQ